MFLVGKIFKLMLVKVLEENFERIGTFPETQSTFGCKSSKVDMMLTLF